MLPASTLDTVAFFADDGTAYTMRVNEVPASSGYGEPITKFFKMADQVKVIAAVTGDPRFTPAERDDGTRRRNYWWRCRTATSRGCRSPLTASNRRRPAASTPSPRPATRSCWPGWSAASPGVMLASRGGHVIHFAIDEVNVLAGVGKGVVGIKLDGGDQCVGGALVSDGRRNELNRLTLEMDNGKADEYTPERVKAQDRGGKGERVRQRVEFVRAVPPPIELVNWDEVEGRPEKKPRDPERNGHAE